MDLERIPKVELHCHLDGIVDPAILRDLHSRGIDVGMSADELERAYPVNDFESFGRWFDAQKGFGSGVDAYRPILAAHAERLRAQNVVYAEIMVAASEISRGDGTDFVGHVRAFREYADELERSDLQIELIAGWNRRRTAEEGDEIAGRILALYEARLIAGVFLAGPEEDNPVQRFARAFTRFHDAGLPAEIHAGEWCGPESVWDALEYGRPRRIGHGVAIFEDPRLLERVRDERIHVEMCPTSNVCTGAVRSIEEHPIARARADGLTFSINSDDPGAFGCTLTGEMRLVAEAFGFTSGDFERIARDTLAARFQPKLRYGNARDLAAI
jgi:adenosine deaminase